MNPQLSSSAISDESDCSKPLHLSAGPLTLIFQAGFIRAVRLGGVEIVRRVYAAIRDEFWNTIPGTIDELSVLQGSSTFHISYNGQGIR
jgi:hypothetical protein